MGQGFTLGKLLDRTGCQILLDTGVTKSYMCNKYKMYLPQAHWGVNQTLIWSQLTM